MRYFKQIGYADKAILIGPDGDRFLPFDTYRDRLFDGKIVATGALNDYLGHTARFIEYVYAASMLELHSTPESLDSLLRSYESYLLLAQDSDDELSRAIANITGRTKKCSPASLPVIEAALTYFLMLSDSIASASGTEGLFSQYLPTILAPISGREAARLRASSALAAVIRGGPTVKRKKNGGLFHATRRRKTNRSKSRQRNKDFDFPLDRIEALIDNTPLYRDKAIYALIAASGMRPGEARQIRLEDIDIENRRVYVVSPFERSNPGITADEFRHLAWKGRETAETFLVEPWATIFFNSLLEYFRREYIPTTGHPFIFQTLNGQSWGRPYYAADRSSRIKQFNKRAAEADVSLPTGVSEHSLRHAYAVYLVNYLPTPQGLGLSLTLVAVLLGHADINSTKTYARHDENLVRATLEWANRAILGYSSLSKKEHLIKYYQSRIEELIKND